MPVYGLGQYADGRPYYAMRFIRGDSLKEAIDRFHADPSGAIPTRASGRSNSASCWAGSSDVCNAIDYAHSRGVLHRDLKPGNIMLGKYGETLVVDWGLAKATGPSRSETAVGRADLFGFVGQRLGRDACTGSRVGTPDYMSPEQAAGKLDLLGPASDVYSLGATLVLPAHRPAAGQRRCGRGLASRTARRRFNQPRNIDPHHRSSAGGGLPQGHGARPEDRYDRAGPGRGYRAVDGRRAGLGLARTLDPAGGTMGRAASHVHGHRRHAPPGGWDLGTSGVRPRATASRTGRRRLQCGPASWPASRQEAVDLTVETVVIDQGELLEAVPLSTRKNVAQQVLPYYDQIVALQGDDVAARAGAAKTLLNRAKLKHTVGTTEDDEGAVADCLQSAELYAAAAPTAQNAAGRTRALVSLGAILGPAPISRGHHALEPGPPDSGPPGRRSARPCRRAVLARLVLE